MVKSVSVKQSSQPPVIRNDETVSSLSIPAVEELLLGLPAPRRPNRVRPIDEGKLREELMAWELASDEAFE